MAENSAISWCDDTFNGWEGCQKVSPACDGCYAEARNLRYAPKGAEAAPNWGPNAPRRRTSASNWAKPLKWEREQAEAWKAWSENGHVPPEPTRFVFCASLADVFDNAVPVEWRRDLFDLIRKTPHLTWLLLTKRPGNIVKLFGEAHLDPPDGGSGHEWPANAFAGTSIEDMKRRDINAVHLTRAKLALDIPTTFWSCEPLLEDLGDIRPWLYGPLAVGWVITGGETDQGSHKARPSHPDWFRSLRDQCAAARVAYHHKQNGEWAPNASLLDHILRHPRAPGFYMKPDGSTPPGTAGRPDARAEIDEALAAIKAGTFNAAGFTHMARVGKKAAGRLLDGVTHDARPEIANG